MLLLSTGLGKRQNCLKNKVTLRKVAKKQDFAEFSYLGYA